MLKAVKLSNQGITPRMHEAGSQGDIAGHCCGYLVMLGLSAAVRSLPAVPVGELPSGVVGTPEFAHKLLLSAFSQEMEEEVFRAPQAFA